MRSRKTVSYICGNLAHSLRTAWVQALRLSPALPSQHLTMGITTWSYAQYARMLSSGLSPVVMANSPLLINPLSPLSTIPIKTMSKYINNLGVIV